MKILDLTTDSVLLRAGLEDVTVVHCQTGNSVMHSGCPKIPPRSALLKLGWELLRARRYDWVIVPPVHLDWTHSNGFARRTIKRALVWLMAHPGLAGIMKKIVFGSEARFVITDYSDQFQPSEFGLTVIAPRHYFMLNVPRTLVGTRSGPANTLIHYLPTVMPDQLIDSLGKDRSAESKYDVFIAGDYHNDQRVKQKQAAEILSGRGRSVFDLKEKSFVKFTGGLRESRLCMAGRGLAYHCFRPLEGAAAGAAPVCHTPEADTYHEYIDGVNCFLYDHRLTPEAVADAVENILLQPDRIPIVVQGARKLLNERHRASVLAKSLVETLKNDG